MAIDRKAPDAVSGMTNKEIDATVTSAKTEGHAAGVIEGKTQAETTAAATTEAAVATAKTAAVKGERSRIQSITTLPEAAGREGSALSLALTTDMSVDQIKPILAGLPKGVVQGARASESPIGLAIDDKKPDAAAGSSWDKALASAGAKLS